MSAFIGFSVRKLGCFEPEDEGRSIYLEACMTEDQMFHALQMFLEEINAETWATWLARIAEEAS